MTGEVAVTIPIDSHQKHDGHPKRKPRMARGFQWSLTKEKPEAMLFVRRNRLKVPAKFSSDIGLSPDDGVQGPEPLGSLRGFDQRDGTRAATAAAAGR